ncbi:hypothetical protein CP8484711_1625B, partial [Chlamydia psittaci 84-8471/1]
GSYHGTCQA